MDRTAWIVVSLCILGIVLLTFRRPPPVVREGQQSEQVENPQGEARGENPPGEDPVPDDPGTNPPPVVDAETVIVSSADQAVSYTFTTADGGIARAELNNPKNHHGIPEGLIKINERATRPIGALGRGDNLNATPIHYTLTRPDERTLQFKGTNASKIEIEKTYKVPGPGEDPYWLKLDVRLSNGSDVPHRANDYQLYSGALSYLHKGEMVQYLLYNWHDGSDADSIQTTWFDGGKFLLLFKTRGPTAVMEKELEQVLWAGSCNQFYATLISPDEPVAGKIWSRRFPVELTKLDGTPATGRYYAVHGGIYLPEIDLAPGESTTLSYHIYTGPRELHRLKRLGRDLEEVMHYDNMPLFGGMLGVIPFFAKRLMDLMVWLKSHIPGIHAYGVAILIITCLIRLLLWPLHARSQKTMKRMALLAPKMNELKEKHADDPQKMQAETMKMYRDYGVNPVGGCLPVFLQLPIFLGFYQMLRSAVELRGEKFLWVPDLSMPDTLFSIPNVPLIGSLPFNLMPLLMAGTMVLQMQLAPKTGDKMQRRIFMLMPLIFLVICYNFASALALYWTGQNIFSIGQTWLMNRRPEPKLEKKPPKKKFDPRQAMQAPGAKPKKPKKRQRRTGG